MAFQFRLQSVLKVRQQDRDLQRQTVMTARRVVADAFSKRDQLAKARDAVINDIRSLNAGEEWDQQKIAQARRYADDLAFAISEAEADIAMATSKLDASIRGLVLADQAAQSLERLAESQIAEFRGRQRKLEEQELQDVTNAQRRSV